MNEEQLHKWFEDYEAGLEISSASRFSKRRKEAMEYADAEFPEAFGLRQVAMTAAKEGRKTETPNELMGMRICQGTSVIVRRFLDKNPEFRRIKRSQMIVPVPAVTKAFEQNNQHPTVVETYMNWIETKDEVPNDQVLAHFIGCTHAAVGSARREAINRGYTFDHKHGGNWKVVNRPIRKADRTSKRRGAPTPEEVERVVKFLLKEKRHA